MVMVGEHGINGVESDYAASEFYERMFAKKTNFADEVAFAKRKALRIKLSKIMGERFSEKLELDSEQLYLLSYIKHTGDADSAYEIIVDNTEKMSYRKAAIKLCEKQEWSGKLEKVLSSEIAPENVKAIARNALDRIELSRRHSEDVSFFKKAALFTKVYAKAKFVAVKKALSPAPQAALNLR